MVKILFVDQTAQLGGAELWLKDIVLARGASDDVFLFQQGPLAELLKQNSVNVSCFHTEFTLAELRKDSGYWQKIRSMRTVLQIVRSVAKSAKNVDAIYANTPKALVVSALAGLWARKPVVYHLHDILTREHFSASNIKLLVALSNRLVSHVVANSQATLDAYRAAGGKQKCSISYNGFEPAAFAQAAERRQEYATAVRSELGIPSAPTLVAVFGRLAPWKGQHVAIEAIGSLPNVHLMLVGDALFGEQDYKAKLLERASAPSVSGRVHLLGFRPDVLQLMQAADMVVHCSVAPEPFGRVIVEAMLSRRPIIAAGAGGAREIITDAGTGFLFTSGDVDSLVSRINYVISLDEVEHAQLVEQAFESASRRFSLAQAVADVNQLVSNVAKRRA